MSKEKSINLVTLMATYNFEIDYEVLPDNLKCVKCKLILKDACAVPCGCTFCRVCIDEIMASGDKFCIGGMEECRESILSHFQTDYKANNGISKLILKCPLIGCAHECPLGNMEDHLVVCQQRNLKCPFHELGCNQAKLAPEEMSSHFQQENRSHSEILIEMIVDINREMDTLKRDQVLKDEQMRTILDQMGHLENENKSIKDEIKLIKEEKVDLANQVRNLSEKIEREINESGAIEHVNREISSILTVVGLNKSESDTDKESINNAIQLINHDIDSIIDNIDSLQLYLQSMQALTGLDKIDASCNWTIDRNIEIQICFDPGIPSQYFIGAVRPYKYQLGAINMINGDIMGIDLRIYRGTHDAELTWPFKGTMVVRVMDKSKRNMYVIKLQECEIEKPSYKQRKHSDSLLFPHSELCRAGISLTDGVIVSCVIIPKCKSMTLVTPSEM